MSSCWPFSHLRGGALAADLRPPRVGPLPSHSSPGPPPPLLPPRRWLTQLSLSPRGTSHPPPHKNVTGLLPSEEVIVLQDHLIRVPHDDPQFIPGQRERLISSLGGGGWGATPGWGWEPPQDLGSRMGQGAEEGIEIEVLGTWGEHEVGARLGRGSRLGAKLRD